MQMEYWEQLGLSKNVSLLKLYVSHPDRSLVPAFGAEVKSDKTKRESVHAIKLDPAVESVSSRAKAIESRNFLSGVARTPAAVTRGQEAFISYSTITGRALQ